MQTKSVTLDYREIRLVRRPKAPNDFSLFKQAIIIPLAEVN